jgi:hypothetical protein
VGPAASLALINSIGNPGGFASPYAIGRVEDVTNRYAGGILGRRNSGPITSSCRCRFERSGRSGLGNCVRNRPGPMMAVRIMPVPTHINRMR